MSLAPLDNSIVDVLAELSRRGISLWLEGDNLRYRAPAGFPPALLDEVRGRRSEVIAFIKDARNSSVIPPLSRYDRAGPAPLTSAQEVWWQLSQKDHDWFPSVAVRLDGPLQPNIVDQVVREIVTRHEVLRTRFPLVSGEPAQVVGSVDDFHVTYLDYSDREDPEGLAVAALDNEHATPFDLTRDIPIRAKLIRVADQSFIFWIVVHHIAVDMRSFLIFNQEFRALYVIATQALPDRVPPPPVQISDVGWWEREWLGDDVEVHRRFWRQQVGAVPPLVVPTVKPRNERDMYQEGALEVALPGSLHADMRALARREGVTVAMMLLAGFQAALSYWSGQDDVLIGIWHRGRVPGVEHVIGLFSRLRPAFASFADDPTFVELLGQVRCRYADTHNLRHTVSRELLADTRIDRVMANFDRTPFVQKPKAGKFTPDIESRLYEPPSAAPRLVAFDLMLALAESPMGVRGTLRYAVDLIGREAAQSLVEIMGTFLENAVLTPEASVKGLLERSAAKAAMPG